MHFVGNPGLVNLVIANKRHLSFGNDLTANEMMLGPILCKGTPASALMNYDRNFNVTDRLHAMTLTPLSDNRRSATSTSLIGNESARAISRLFTRVFFKFLSD